MVGEDQSGDQIRTQLSAGKQADSRRCVFGYALTCRGEHFNSDREQQDLRSACKTGSKQLRPGREIEEH